MKDWTVNSVLRVYKSLCVIKLKSEIKILGFFCKLVIC